MLTCACNKTLLIYINRIFTVIISNTEGQPSYTDNADKLTKVILFRQAYIAYLSYCIY